MDDNTKAFLGEAKEKYLVESTAHVLKDGGWNRLIGSNTFEMKKQRMKTLKTHMTQLRDVACQAVGNDQIQTAVRELLELCETVLELRNDLKNAGELDLSNLERQVDSYKKMVKQISSSNPAVQAMKDDTLNSMEMILANIEFMNVIRELKEACCGALYLELPNLEQPSSMGEFMDQQIFLNLVS